MLVWYYFYMESSHSAQDPHIFDIESHANFEGNDSVLLIERVNNPVIRAQIVDILYKNELLEVERMNKLVFTPFSSPELKNLICFKDQHGVVYTSKDPNYNPGNYVPTTRDEIEKSLTESIEHVASQTTIDFSENEPSENHIPINWEIPWSGKKPTSKQMSIIEAHEKGHSIRQYAALHDYFSKGFDPSKIEYTNKDFEMDVLIRRNSEHDKNASMEEMKADMVEYLFSGPEIAERMSQLKNYFGMNGSEQFTKEHLDYARTQYVADTGMDNRMTHFFQAITPETEATFLELINSSGI